MAAPAIDWAKLLVDAVTKPGVIAEAYQRFWNYSVGNQILALFQCLDRKIEPGPINTFLGWRGCGRSVKKGEKALTLCMPIKRTLEKPAKEDGADPTKVTLTRFIYRPHWFVLSQTDGAAYVPAELPEWDQGRALAALQVELAPFDSLNGNVQGYASGRQVTVSPIAFEPQRTLFHEIAHVVLGHTEEVKTLIDEMTTTRSIREVEAESVAMICCASLGLPGIEHSRGYIQHWIKTETIPERSAQHIFKAADQILRAGYPQPPTPRGAS